MNTPAEQLVFPFSSLDFPGRQTLTADEVAQRLGATVQHILDLIEEGELGALDLAGKGASRRFVRIPIESYREFIVARMTGAKRRELMAALPKPTLRALLAEIKALLLSPPAPSLATAAPSGGSGRAATSLHS